jgi:hypothetical protein
LGVFGLVIAPVNLLRIIMLPISLLIGEASLLALIVSSPVVLEVLVIAVLPLLILYAYSPTRRIVSGILFIFMAEVAMLLGIYDCMRGKQTVLWTRGTKYQPQRVTCLGSTR